MEKSRDAQVAEIRNKFQKFCLHARQRLRELGGRCLEYPVKGGTVGSIVDRFTAEIKALPGTLA
jgi:hypothetical protein